MNTITRAWVAGLLEGEGSFHMRSNKSYRYPIVQATSTDLDVLERLQKMTGIGRVNGPYRVGRPQKPVYQWNVNRSVQALALMRELLPYMSQRRQQKIQDVLDEWDRR